MRTFRSTGLAAIAALALAAPAAVRADHARHGGVTIDAHGVHFHLGSGVHYAYVDWPHARSFFAANRHYRKSVKLEKRRDTWLRRTESYLSDGDLDNAERAFRKAYRAEARRQRQLAKLETDRARFEQRHRHVPRHRRSHRRAGWRH